MLRLSSQTYFLSFLGLVSMKTVLDAVSVLEALQLCFDGIHLPYFILFCTVCSASLVTLTGAMVFAHLSDEDDPQSMQH